MRTKKIRASQIEPKSGEPVSRVTERPSIFRYHEYLVFFRDWLAFRKASQSDFSLRSLAKKAGLAAGYLPMVLSGKRPLSAKALSKLAPFLDLSPAEHSFLESLFVLGTSDFHQAHLSALTRMKRFQLYQKHNPQETQVYQYLTHWYYVAIREMASIPGFKLDIEWIQKQLLVPVPLQELKTAVDFLVKNKFVDTDSAGQVKSSDTQSLDCTSEVYRVALAQFHREVFELATQAIQIVPREKRNILGHTFALGEDQYEEAKAIVEEAIAKVRKLGAHPKPGDSVYHLEVALIPLAGVSKKGGSSDSGK